MTTTLRTTRTALVTVTLAGTLCGLPLCSLAAAPSPDAGAAAQSASTQSNDVAIRLDKKQYRNVKVSVDQGTATLTGTVDLYQYKADADKRARKTKGVTAVRDLIEVAGPVISDRDLENKLRDKLAYDRVFYGNAFNAITVDVENGGVTLGGHAVSPFARDSALALVSNYPGVKNVADEIEVDPVSMLDNRIRMQVFRAVYGFPTLNKYAIDPAKPIRISVQNGHVELYGMVNTEGDKDVAYMRANLVPGVFKVTNYLQVAEPSVKKQK